MGRAAKLRISEQPNKKSRRVPYTYNPLHMHLTNKYTQPAVITKIKLMYTHNINTRTHLSVTLAIYGMWFVFFYLYFCAISLLTCIG